MTYNDDYERQRDARDAAEGAAGAERAAHPGAQSLQDEASIKAGLSHDKVAGVDLAAAPMGADAEAGGAVAEVGTPPPAGPQGGSARDPNRANAIRPAVPWIWILVAIIAAVVVGVALLGATGG